MKKVKAAPPIDYLKAVAAERKTTLKYSFDDLAAMTGYSAGALRNAWSSHSPSEWSDGMRTAVFKALQIDTATARFMALLSDSPNAKISYNINTGVVEISA